MTVINYNRKIVSELEIELKKQEEDSLLNPLRINKCKKYFQLKEDLSISKNKVRRQILNELNEIETDKELPYYISLYNKLEQLKKDIIEYNDYIYYCEHYVERKVHGIFQVLEENGFIIMHHDKDTPDGSTISLMEKGLIASSIHEIHPLIYTDLYSYNKFTPLSATDLFCLLSCFYPTKGIEITPPFLKEEIKFIDCIILVIYRIIQSYDILKKLKIFSISKLKKENNQMIII
jgi:hypothetical protein